MWVVIGKYTFFVLVAFGFRCVFGYFRNGFWKNSRHRCPGNDIWFARDAIKRSIIMAENQPKPWDKLTPSRRRKRRQRRNAKLRDYVLMGKIQISQELMQFVQSPKWRKKIAEAAITRMVSREQAESKVMRNRYKGEPRYRCGYRSAYKEQ